MPTERTESILSGMVAGFEFFGVVGREVWWDNPRTVATAILRGRQRRVHERYAGLANHYCFEAKFCMPASGWEKPRVENRVYDLQRRWATPVPTMKDFHELNAHLRRCCLAELDRTVAGQHQTIGARFEQEKAAAQRLPKYGFDPCVTTPAKVDHYQRVQYDRARYSVPRSSEAVVTVKAYPDRIEIVSRGRVIAQAPRRYDGGQELNPLHYLVTLERRPGALDHSNVYRRWDLPVIFAALREQLEQRHGEEKHHAPHPRSTDRDPGCESDDPDRHRHGAKSGAVLTRRSASLCAELLDRPPEPKAENGEDAEHPHEPGCGHWMQWYDLP
jgi:hypothetical protein